MSSVAYNLTRKLEWMGRTLRRIDDAGEIRDWVAAMSAINGLLKQVDIKICSDDWQPWCKSKGVKRDSSERVWESKDSIKSKTKINRLEVNRKFSLNEKLRKTSTKKVGLKNPIPKKLVPPRVQVEVDDTEMIDPNTNVPKVVHTIQEEAGSESPKLNGILSDDVEVKKKLLLLAPITEGKIRSIWRGALIKRLEATRYDGCEYKGILAEWHPREHLLEDIAKTLNRSYKEDMTENLRKFLVEVTAKYHKERGYF